MVEFKPRISIQKQNPSSEKSVKSKTFRFFLWALLFVAMGTLILFIFFRDYFTLATIMLRIDLFSFGGGLPSMPIMYHELVDLTNYRHTLNSIK